MPDNQAYEQAKASTFLTIFSCVPKPQRIDSGCLYLVTHFILSDKNPPHLTRLKFLQPLTDTRILQQAYWRCRLRLSILL